MSASNRSEQNSQPKRSPAKPRKRKVTKRRPQPLLARWPRVDVATIQTKVQGVIAGARTATEAGVESARDKGRRAANATTGYVREHPWMAIGVATGAGVLFGLAARLRRRSYDE